MTTEGAFHICLATPLGDKGDYTYAAFANNTRRHDKYYITNLVKEISLHDLLAKHEVSFKKEAILIHDEESDSDIYVKAYPKKEINKRNAGWSLSEGYFPVLYINDKNVPIIRRKDLVRKS